METLGLIMISFVSVLIQCKQNFLSVMRAVVFGFKKTDQIDENLKQALQKDLNVLAPGLTIQVNFFSREI